MATPASSSCFWGLWGSDSHCQPSASSFPRSRIAPTPPSAAPSPRTHSLWGAKAEISVSQVLSIDFFHLQPSDRVRNDTCTDDKHSQHRLCRSNLKHMCTTSRTCLWIPLSPSNTVVRIHDLHNVHKQTTSCLKLGCSYVNATWVWW